MIADRVESSSSNIELLRFRWNEKWHWAYNANGHRRIELSTAIINWISKCKRVKDALCENGNVRNSFVLFHSLCRPHTFRICKFIYSTIFGMLGQQKPATVHTNTHTHNIKYYVERLCCVLYDEHQTRTHNKTALTPFNSFFMMRFTSTAPTMASHFWSEWFPANDKKSRHRDFTAHHQKPHSRKNGNMNINKNKRTDKQTKAAAAFCQNQM